MTDVEAFYEHLSTCEHCYGCGDALHSHLCEYGRELLLEAAEDLPRIWQDEAKRIYRKEQLEREAEEQARYYGGMGEF